MGTPNLNLDHIAGSQNNKETTANTTFDGLDNAMNALLDKTSISDIELTTAEFRGYHAFRLSGVASSGFTLAIPVSISRLFSVINNSSQAVQIETVDAASTGQSLASGSSGVFYSDGDEIVSLGGGGGGGVSSVPFTMTIAASDEITALTASTGKVKFRMPAAITLTEVRASVSTAPTDDDIIVDINEGGVSILSTKLFVEAGETTSLDSAYEPIISDTSLADDAEITIDLDQVGSTISGAGLKITLIGTYV